jgi:hypothetical protein
LIFTALPSTHAAHPRPFGERNVAVRSVAAPSGVDAVDQPIPGAYWLITAGVDCVLEVGAFVHTARPSHAASKVNLVANGQPRFVAIPTAASGLGAGLRPLAHGLVAYAGPG